LLPVNVASTESGVPFRLNLRIQGKPYVLTVTPQGFKLVLKGKRKGVEMPWAAFVSDDAVLYSELQASIRRILGGKT
jgi:ribosomal protein S6E (S10)